MVVSPFSGLVVPTPYPASVVTFANQALITHREHLASTEGRLGSSACGFAGETEA